MICMVWFYYVHFLPRNLLVFCLFRYIIWWALWDHHLVSFLMSSVCSSFRFLWCSEALYCISSIWRILKRVVLATKAILVPTLFLKPILRISHVFAVFLEHYRCIMFVKPYYIKSKVVRYFIELRKNQQTFILG